MILVLAMLLAHDIWYSQLHEVYEAYKLRDVPGASESETTEHSRASDILLIVELSIMALFLVDIMIHALAYGLLFLKHLVPIMETLLILANVAILIVQVDEKNLDIDRNGFFGIKIIFAVALLYLRLETLRIQIASLRKPSSQRI